MPKPTKEKRAHRSITLDPTIDAELQREADGRLLNPSLLIQNALAAYLPTLPPLSGNGTEAPTP